MLPEGMHAKVNKSSYQVPEIFKMLAREGNIAEEAMYNTFNMGIGMALIVDSNDADKSLKLLSEAGEQAYIIGEVEKGERGVTLC